LIDENNDTLVAKMDSTRKYIVKFPNTAYTIAIFSNSKLLYKRYLGCSRHETISKIYIVLKFPHLPIIYSISSKRELSVEEIYQIKESIISGEESSLVQDKTCYVGMVF